MCKYSPDRVNSPNTARYRQTDCRDRYSKGIEICQNIQLARTLLIDEIQQKLDLILKSSNSH